MTHDIVPIGSQPTTLATITPTSLYDAVLSGRRATTLKSYRADYEAFRRFIGASTAAAALESLVALPQGAANAVVLAWRGRMTDDGLASATIARRLSAIRSAVRVARMLGRCGYEIEVELPRVEAYRDTTGPGSDGYRKMLAVAKAEAETGNPIAVRNLAVLRLLHDLGLRRFEATGLDLADVDLEGSKVWILGKGKSARLALTLPPATRAALAAWLAIRGVEPGPCFPRLDPAAGPLERLSGDSVCEMVKALAKRAGITKPVRAHSIRHEAISEALDRLNGDLRSAAKFSRHANLSTIGIYDDRRRDRAGEVARLVAGDE